MQTCPVDRTKKVFQKIDASTAAGDRFDRSRGRSIESIDSIDSIILQIFRFFLPRRGARDLSCVKVSALYDAWRLKKRRKNKMKKFGFLVKFGSVGSIIRSIRSIACRWAMVDCPGAVVGFVTNTHFSTLHELSGLS